VTQLTSDATLFAHTPNDPKRGAVLTIAQAARALVALQCYGLGYKQFVDAPCTKGVVFLMQGDTLFETLVLNMILYPQEEGDYYSTSNDAPAWEHVNPFLPMVDGKPVSRDASVVVKAGRKELQYENHTPLGYLDYLTWQNRKIKLLSSDGKTVRRLAWSPGIRLVDNVVDPMQSYSDSENGWRPKAFSSDRALWRDSDVLLKTVESGKVKPLAAVAWISRLARHDAELLPKVYRLVAFGMSKKQAKLEFLRFETSPLPIDYLHRENLLSDLSVALENAEKAGKLLNRCAYLLAWLVCRPSTPDEKFEESDEASVQQTKIDRKMNKGSNPQSDDREAQQAYQLFSFFGVERVYWSQLEAHFYRLVQDLPNDPYGAKQTWREHLKRVANSAFNQAIAYAGTDRRAQRAIVKAEEQFRHGLARLLNIKQTNPIPGGENNVTN
jgi:CRISPR type I-E-associated protein CasA/Cse1